MMLTVKFRSALWLYAGPGGWHFITLPPKHVAGIKASLKGMRRGWGSIPVQATIGDTTWKTSIFPDRKSNSYLLPVKAAVRNKEGIEDGDKVSVSLDLVL